MYNVYGVTQHKKVFGSFLPLRNKIRIITYRRNAEVVTAGLNRIVEVLRESPEENSRRSLEIGNVTANTENAQRELSSRIVESLTIVQSWESSRVEISLARHDLIEPC